MERTERAVISRTSSKGNQIEIGVVIDGDATWVYSKIDGQRDACVLGPGKLSRPREIAGRIITHVIGTCGLAADEMPLLEAALTAAREAARQTPEGMRAQRQSLVAKINATLDATEQARERAFDRDIGGIPSYDSPAYRAAKAALEAFDATHPEVRAAIEQERQESIKRHMWD